MTLNQSPENKSRFAEMARGLYVRPISHEEQKLSLDNLMENYQYLLETAPPSMVSFFVEFVTKTLKEDGRHQDAQKFARRVSRLNKKASVRQ